LAIKQCSRKSNSPEASGRHEVNPSPETGGAENTPGTIAKSPDPMNTNDELTDSEIDAIADRGDELLSHNDNYCEAINAFF
jgi:hypothetical protein